MIYIIGMLINISGSGSCCSINLNVKGIMFTYIVTSVGIIFITV